MPDWTPEQTLAMNATECDLLVSASAGTGKTAVLVERVIRLATRGDAPTDLDRFLVVTFTEAAATEMREKIAAALRERLSDVADPRGEEAERVRRQRLLLDHARISTIHAFCATLLRRHFHRLGLDPVFAVLDEQEGRLLRSEVAEAVFEEAFQNPSPRFTRWLDQFAGANPEDAARYEILGVHSFLQALDDPKGWIARVRRDYPLDENGEGVPLRFQDHHWFPAWLAAMRREFVDIRDRVRQLLKDAERVEQRYLPWLRALDEALEDFRKRAKARDWAAALDSVQGFKFRRLPGPKEKSPEQEALKNRLDDVKKRFTDKFLKDLAPMTAEQATETHARSAPVVHLMLDLTERFEEAYADAKRARAVLDFGDLEQMSLRLLRDEQDPERPSDVAWWCRDQFDHILVDEYQDINPVQDAILRFAARGEDDPRPNNLFLVGDVKQSIYAFREAAPEIFLEKYDSFKPLDAESAAGANGRARVDLTRNFRSRRGVLGGVNAMFRRIMTREGSGVDYDEAAALRYGAAYPPLSPPEVEPLPIEFHLLEGDASDGENGTDEEESPADWEATEREAFLIARRIREMVGSRGDGSDAEFMVTDRDPETGEPCLRPVEYRDIVILMRSPRSSADSYLSALSNAGVPAFADLGSGYFAAAEVRDVLNLLRLLDNFQQDIPLAAVLRSPLEGWSETELARVRAAGSKGPFHRAFRSVAERPDDAAELDRWRNGVGPRAEEFLTRLDAWRTRARREPLADLIAAVYEETGYPAYVLGRPGGETRRANLVQLHELAIQFDQRFARQGLGRFLRFVDQLCEQEGDFGPASALAENRNVVRLMSIHKSKGLEFPVVILARLGGGYNKADARGSLLMSRTGGLGVKLVDLERSVRYPTSAFNVLKQMKSDEQIAEEMRILYVGMTRARERLILCGAVKKPGNRQEQWREIRDAAPDGRMPTGRILGAGSALDWIGPAVEMASRSAGSETEPWDGAFWLVLHTVEDMRGWDVETEAEKPAPAWKPTTQDVDNDAKVEAAMRRMRWSYPRDEETRLPSRLSVSEVKRRLQADEEEGMRPRRVAPDRERFELPELPAPDSAEPATAAARGSLTHLVLQHVDLLGALDYFGLSAQVDAMIDRGLLEEAERKQIDLEAIAEFFASPLGARVLATPPDRVWREVPFIIGLSPREVGLPRGDEAGASDEIIRVQGVVDCVVQEDDGLLLIDYKTDAIPVDWAPRRAEGYRHQMRLYALAVERVFGAPPSEAHIYFLEPRADRIVDV